MTIEDVTPRIEFAAGGTSYPFAFSFQENSDILVTLLDAARNPTVLYEGTEYTLTNEAPGGTVTLLSTPTAGNFVVIERQTPLTQPTQMPTNGVVPTTLFEQLIDRATALVQELSFFVNSYTVQVPEGFTEAMVLPTPVAGEILKWNSTADGIANETYEDLTTALVNGLDPNTPLTQLATITVQLAAGDNYLVPLPNDIRLAQVWIDTYPAITEILRFRNGVTSVMTNGSGTNFAMTYTPSDSDNFFRIVCSGVQDITYTPAPYTAIMNRALSMYGLILSTLTEYADNAAAVSAERPVGYVYRTVDALKVVHA